ncbi:adenosylmethionine decarboxylase [Microlunatus speluncae]|uniref:adenosylmethionine decarboxylase n=1 Tax=Microlunatus speluncae TaxID=2594267 RepID=UPI001375F1D8|nr:adenosylmethionine decarboxylase [Microlunatus speluncae]
MSSVGTNHRSVSGRHLVLDLFGCDPGLLDNPTSLRSLLTRAATEAGAHVLEVSSHRFEPHGVTMVLLLAESHLAIHTWPEERFAAMDIFTCGDTMRPEAAAEIVAEGLRAESYAPTTIARGGER